MVLQITIMIMVVLLELFELQVLKLNSNWNKFEGNLLPHITKKTRG